MDDKKVEKVQIGGLIRKEVMNKLNKFCEENAVIKVRIIEKAIQEYLEKRGVR